jgi:glutamate-1-semialdehyde 2,1-aminomutase
MLRDGSTRAYIGRAEKIMPGCCLASMYLPPGRRTVIERAEGAYLYDPDGRSYLDFALGSGPMILGHAHPAVVEAVCAQAANGSTYFIMNTLAVELAERLVEAIPCAQSLRFQTTGSDATAAAMRLARAATGRSKILQFEGAYHGGHDQGQLAAVLGDYPIAAPQSDGLPRGAAADVLVAPFNDIRRTTEIIAANAGDLAAVIVEPLHRMFRPKPGFLAALKDVTHRNGALLIFDEVVTGFRLAWGGGQELYGVAPDLACYGKALGGGYPLSAVVGRKDLIALADPGRKGKEPFCFVGGTLTGNPVACAAGFATLDVLGKPGAYERLGALGRRLRDGLQRVAQRHGQTLQVLGEGSILQVVFLDGPEPVNHAGLRGADTAKSSAFVLGMVDEGVFMNPGGKFYVSLAHQDNEIDAAVEAADRVLSNFQH